MQRITITLPEELCAELDAFVQARRYQTRSEALRDLLRRALSLSDHAAPEGAAIGVLSYVFDHHLRDLSRRLMAHHHAHHALGICSSHVHLDHDTCLETAILRGPAQALRAYADGVLGQRGVIHGNLSLIPVEAQLETHDHGQGDGDHTHLHVRESF